MMWLVKLILAPIMSTDDVFLPMPQCLQAALQLHCMILTRQLPNVGHHALRYSCWATHCLHLYSVLITHQSMCTLDRKQVMKLGQLTLSDHYKLPNILCNFVIWSYLNLTANKPLKLITLPLIFPLMRYFWYISADLLWHTAFLATDSLSDPITQKTSWWKVVALCINKVLFMSYQSDNSLTDVNVICTVLWPKTASSSSAVIDKGAPSVTEHSTHSCYKKTVNYLM